MIPASIHNILSFNGTSSQVQLPNASDLKLNNSSFTVQAWIRFNELPDTDLTVLGTDVQTDGKGLCLMIRAKMAYFGFHGNDTSGTKVLEKDEWYHLTWRYTLETQEQAIFINGQLDAKASGKAPFTGMSTVRIGRRGTDAYFNGDIAELMLWDYPLDDAAIASASGMKITGVPQGLTGYWSLDDGEESTEVADTINAAQQGTLTDTTWSTEIDVPFRQTPDRNNNVLQFNGIDNCVNLPKADVLNISNNSFTVEAWIKPRKLTTSDHTIIGTDTASVNKGLHFIVRNKMLYLGFYGNDLIGKTEIKEGVWQHVAWMYDKDKQEQTLFLNGEVEATEGGHLPFIGTAVVKVSRWAGGRYFNGDIAELAFWSSPIGPDRVKASMVERPKGNEEDLTAYFAMNEGTGAVINDYNSNGMTGKILKATWASYESIPFRPLSKATGQLQKLMSKVKQAGNTKITTAKVEANGVRTSANDRAAAQLKQAHTQATNLVNTTKFTNIYYISGNRLKKIDPAGRIQDFDLVNTKTYTKTVNAGQLWQSSGITVQAHEKVSVRYKSGRWTANPSTGMVDANGNSRYNAKSGYALPGAKEGALIGKIGNSAFLLGNSGQVPQNLTGELFYVINDDVSAAYGSGFRDNSGTINVDITVEPKSTSHAPEILAYDMALDPVDKKIYLARHITPFEINVVDFDGQNFKKLYSGSKPITSLALDDVNKVIYFIEGTGVVHKINVDGSGHAELLDVSAPIKDNFWRIDVDIVGKRFYWSNESSIWSAALDGTDAKLELAGSDAPAPVDLLVDDDNPQIYWIDKEVNALLRADAGGKSVLQFDGANSYVEINEPFENNAQFTISCWVKTSALNDGAHHGFIGKQNDEYRKPSMWQSPSDGGFRYDSYDAKTGQRFSDTLLNFFEEQDKWIHVAWVKEGSEFRFYRNGVFFDKRAAPETFYTTNTSYWIGRVDALWKGQISEVQIWNRPLTVEEINVGLYSRINGEQEGLVQYFPLNDGSGTVATNRIDKKNNGVIKSSTWNKSNDLPIKNAEILYKVDVPRAGMALDQEIQQIYWTASDSEGRHYMMRGSMNGLDAEEKLFEISCEGGIGLLSKGILEHEQRLLAYKKRKEAQEKAAADLSKANGEAHARVQDAHQEYHKKQEQATAEVATAQSSANDKRTKAQAELSAGQGAAKRKVDNATSAANAKRENAQSDAGRIKQNADNDASRVKNNAQSNLNNARKERAKY